MKLIIGLGNPGARYAATRHNIGFRVVDEFARKYRISLDTSEKDAVLGRGRVAGRSVIVAKPTTFMNLSGIAVGKLVRAYLENIDDMIVVYDDIDLPLGKLRIRRAGSPGTHNGMRSLVESLASESFPRLRFGIRGESWQGARDLADYVLEEWDEGEEPLLAEPIARSVDALLLFVRDELGRAMNEFNRDPRGKEGDGEPDGDSR